MERVAALFLPVELYVCRLLRAVNRLRDLADMLIITGYTDQAIRAFTTIVRAKRSPRSGAFGFGGAKVE